MYYFVLRVRHLGLCIQRIEGLEHFPIGDITVQLENLSNAKVYICEYVLVCTATRHLAKVVQSVNPQFTASFSMKITDNS